MHTHTLTHPHMFRQQCYPSERTVVFQHTHTHKQIHTPAHVQAAFLSLIKNRSIPTHTYTQAHTHVQAALPALRKIVVFQRTYIHKHTCTHTHTHTYTHTHIFAPTHVQVTMPVLGEIRSFPTHTHTLAHTHIHTLSHMHTHILLHTHVQAAMPALVRASVAQAALFWVATESACMGES